MKTTLRRFHQANLLSSLQLATLAVSMFKSLKGTLTLESQKNQATSSSRIKGLHQWRKSRRDLLLYTAKMRSTRGSLSFKISKPAPQSLKRSA
jgi:hypothetical protein